MSVKLMTGRWDREKSSLTGRVANRQQVRAGVLQMDEPSRFASYVPGFRPCKPIAPVWTPKADCSGGLDEDWFWRIFRAEGAGFELDA